MESQIKKTDEILREKLELYQKTEQICQKIKKEITELKNEQSMKKSNFIAEQTKSFMEDKRNHLETN